jgi:hypothetical protein
MADARSSRQRRSRVDGDPEGIKLISPGNALGIRTHGHLIAP